MLSVYTFRVEKDLPEIISFDSFSLIPHVSVNECYQHKVAVHVIKIHYSVLVLATNDSFEAIKGVG